jgi:hypothetical protein
MRLCRLFVIPLLLAALQAGATTVLFTDSFTLAAGAPQVFDRSFAVNTSDTCDGRARYFLTVITGDAAGKHAISSGVIALNGTTVLREEDFRDAPHTIVLGITPGATNTLHIDLKGGSPGSVLGVAISREIETPILAKTYTATKSGSTFSESVSIDAGAQYALLARNGAEDGTGAVQSVAIRFNGAQVLSQNDLRNGRTITIPVLLPASPVQLTGALRGTDGTTLTLTLVKVLDERACVNFAIQLTVPTDGATVTTRPLLVRGTMIGGRDVGVAVNSIPAQLDLTHTGLSGDPIPWVAVFHAAPATLTLTATATATNGQHRDASVTITYAPPKHIADFDAVPPAGTAPLDVTFRIGRAPGQTITLYELDLDGDGAYETTYATLPAQITKHYDTPGLRIVSLRTTDAAGQKTIASTPVEVDSFAAVDAIIQARWSAFRALLAAGNINDALAFFDDTEREKNEALLQLIQPTLPQFAAEMATIRAVYVRGDVAHYLLTRTVNGTTQGFPVYFNRGADGLWKIVQY